jgi:N-acetylglucosamine repressor
MGKEKKTIQPRSSGTNHDDLQQMNRVLVLSLMRKYPITTRADLAKMTGLERATLTNIISHFIECGIVRETGFIEGNKGRRSIGIALNGIQYKVIAIRLARMYFTIALFDITGEMHIKKEIAIDFMDGSEHARKLIKQEIKHILDTTEKVISIGIALPGPYLKNENKIGQISDFPGWEGVNIIKETETAFGIPTYAEHDGNASTLAEWWFGGLHCTENTVLMTVLAGQGTGIGIIDGGALLQGGHGCAGELGHASIAYDGPLCACGNRGCLDLYCSSIILMKHIKESLPNYPDSCLNKGLINYETLTVAIDNGDELALKEIQRMGKFLAFGLVNAINMYDPNIIVIGDELARIGKNVLLETIKSTIKQRILPNIYDNLRIQLSTLEDSMLLGAMTVATDNAFNKLNFMNCSK